MTSDLRAAVESVRERIASASERSGRDPRSVRVVAAVKGRDHRDIEAVVAAGIDEVGENRAQELRDHELLIGSRVQWHFLGAIQTNKVRLLEGVELVHGLDRLAEAAALQSVGERLARSWDVLVQVNIVGEPSKQGIRPGQIPKLLDGLAAYPLVNPRGFMIVAPEAENEEDVRWVFTQARLMRERYKPSDPRLQELSMGMTNDFEVAIEEGATIVRIGRAIFGA